jgi:hypothetical protein
MAEFINVAFNHVTKTLLASVMQSGQCGGNAVVVIVFIICPFQITVCRYCTCYPQFLQANIEIVDWLL